MKRGEIRWYRFAKPDKRRPVLILTRDSVLDSMNEIIIAPVTRTIRGIATEVVTETAQNSLSSPSPSRPAYSLSFTV